MVVRKCVRTTKNRQRDRLLSTRVHHRVARRLPRVILPSSTNASPTSNHILFSLSSFNFLLQICDPSDYSLLVIYYLSIAIMSRSAYQSSLTYRQVQHSGRASPLSASLQVIHVLNSNYEVSDLMLDRARGRHLWRRGRIALSGLVQCPHG